MKRGYINLTDIKNAPELSDEIKPPKKAKQFTVEPLWYPPKGYYKELTKDFWDGDKLKEPAKPRTGWIWQLDEMVEVMIVERYRKVFWKWDENGKRVNRRESYTTHIIPPDAKRWNKDGELITESEPSDELLAILDPIEKTKTNVKPELQLSLFI
jgi:hypothetical protein